MNSSLEQLSCYEKKHIIVSICFYCNAGIHLREEKDVTHDYLLPSDVPTVFPGRPPYKQTHGPAPPHSVLFRVRICSFPLFESTPYLRTANISEPPFRGLFAGFSCLGDPPKSWKMVNVPPLIRNNFLGVQRDEREKEKNTPFLKKSPGEKSNTPLFLQFSGRTLSHEKYPFTGHFGNTHAVISNPEWGPGPMAQDSQQNHVQNTKVLPCLQRNPMTLQQNMTILFLSELIRNWR